MQDTISVDIRRTAFTLAEVLITLGIIGIVAAMTMPALIGNYQKAQTVNQLKKAYSEISQAIKISEAQYDTLDSWDFSGFTNAQERADYFAKNYLFPNIKILQSCSPTSEKCWADSYTIDGAKANISTNGRDGRNSFITSSGYAVYYWLHGTGNGGWFFIDLNGLKKPNKLGKDVFIFMMSWEIADLQLPVQAATNALNINWGFYLMECTVYHYLRQEMSWQKVHLILEGQAPVLTVKKAQTQALPEAFAELLL